MSGYRSNKSIMRNGPYCILLKLHIHESMAKDDQKILYLLQD